METLGRYKALFGSLGCLDALVSGLGFRAFPTSPGIEYRGPNNQNRVLGPIIL